MHMTRHYHYDMVHKCTYHLIATRTAVCASPVYERAGCILYVMSVFLYKYRHFSEDPILSYLAFV